MTDLLRVAVDFEREQAIEMATGREPGLFEPHAAPPEEDLT